MPFVKAISLLGDPNFLIFLVISFVVTTQLQFYYLGTSRFLEDIGTSHTAIPAAMSIAQIAQVVAMGVILPLIFKPLGFQWILAMGTAFWLIMFLVYARMRPRSLIIASMALHGLAFRLLLRRRLHLRRADGSRPTSAARPRACIPR